MLDHLGTEPTVVYLKKIDPNYHEQPAAHASAGGFGGSAPDSNGPQVTANKPLPMIYG